MWLDRKIKMISKIFHPHSQSILSQFYLFSLKFLKMKNKIIKRELIYLKKKHNYNFEWIILREKKTLRPFCDLVDTDNKLNVAFRINIPITYFLWFNVHPFLLLLLKIKNCIFIWKYIQKIHFLRTVYENKQNFMIMFSANYFRKRKT